MPIFLLSLSSFHLSILFHVDVCFQFRCVPVLWLANVLGFFWTFFSIALRIFLLHKLLWHCPVHILAVLLVVFLVWQCFCLFFLWSFPLQLFLLYFHYWKWAFTFTQPPVSTTRIISFYATLVMTFNGPTITKSSNECGETFVSYRRYFVPLTLNWVACPLVHLDVSRWWGRVYLVGFRCILAMEIPGRLSRQFLHSLSSLVVCLIDVL